MKIKIIKSICFVLILSVILILLSKLLEPKNNSVEAGMHYRGASGVLAEPDNTIDVVYIGNSEAYTSIIPMEMWNDHGYTGYVCASPEQLLPVSTKILGETVKHQKPKLIVLEASNLNVISDLSEASDQVLNYGLKVFQYHDRWKNLSKEDFTTKPEYTTENYMKGYEYSDMVAGLDIDSSSEKKMDEVAIPKSNQAYVKLIKKIGEQNGAKLVMVSVPCYEYWSHKTHDEIQGFCDKNGIDYIDLNLNKDDVGIDWKNDTSDRGNHLNHKGALKTTKYLGKQLKERYKLEDHRHDEKYKHWNEQYEKYKDIVKKQI